MGKVRAPGVSNFCEAQLQFLIDKVRADMRSETEAPDAAAVG